MTIKKGEDWGERTLVPAGTPIVDSDAALAGLFAVNDGGGELELSGPEMVGLIPNDRDSKDPRASSNGLARTMGARGTIDSLAGNERTVVPIDLGIVTVNPGSETTRHLVMAASLVVCGRFWAGVTEAAMNAAFLADWNVTPSGHPNDGRFDVVRAELSIGDRLKARKRLVSGAHLPHPDISVRRLKTAEFEPVPSARVWIDGRMYRDVARVLVVVVPDAVSVAI